MAEIRTDYDDSGKLKAVAVNTKILSIAYILKGGKYYQMESERVCGTVSKPKEVDFNDIPINFRRFFKCKRGSTWDLEKSLLEEFKIFG